MTTKLKSKARRIRDEVVQLSTRLCESATAALEGRQGEVSTMVAETAAGRILQLQARAAFELTLAERAATARSIEVEEFTEDEGEGLAGLDANNQTLGVRGQGRRVVRRVIKLSGWPDITLDED